MSGVVTHLGHDPQVVRDEDQGHSGLLLQLLEQIKVLQLNGHVQKGVPEWVVIAKHAFRNAMIPVLTLAGIQLVVMINVAVVVEVIFSWPGSDAC